MMKASNIGNRKEKPHFLLQKLEKLSLNVTCREDLLSINNLKKMIFDLVSKHTTNPSLSLEVYNNTIQDLEKEINRWEKEINKKKFLNFHNFKH
ncbi:MAG: hypothetical protein ACK4J0_00645 [Candidatus Anstonellaceae archaeon]